MIKAPKNYCNHRPEFLITIPIQLNHQDRNAPTLVHLKDGSCHAWSIVRHTPIKHKNKK